MNITHKLIRNLLKSNQWLTQINIKRSYYIPRRALMYIPGNDNRKLLKSLELNADCIALDCEDGVAINRKAEARENIRKFITEYHDCFTTGNTVNKRSIDLAVRLNSVESGLCDEDLRVLLSDEILPSTLLLPKINRIDDIKYFSDRLQKYIHTSQTFKGHLNLIWFAESCESIMNLPELCRKIIDYGKSMYKPVAIVFGSDDFCASLGATRTEDSQEILYARQKVVLVAKAFDFQAIDMVYIDYKNSDGLQKQSEEGFRMGYTGKQVIHPGQIEIVQKSFTPSVGKIQWATELIQSYQMHLKDGKGAYVFQNKMIDMPTIKQAQNVVDLIASIDASQTKKF